MQKDQDLEVSVIEVSRDKRKIALGLKQLTDDPWPELINKYETGKKVSGEIIKILDKGIILQLDEDVEGIIPFGKRNSKERKEKLSNFKSGDELNGLVMEVKPDEKKIVIYNEDISDAKNSSSKGDVQEYLSEQDEPAAQKIEIPDELSEESPDEEKTK